MKINPSVGSKFMKLKLKNKAETMRIIRTFVFMTWLFSAALHAEMPESSLEDAITLSPETHLIVGQSENQGVAVAFNSDSVDPLISYTGAISENGFEELFTEVNGTKTLKYKGDFCLVSDLNGDKKVYKRASDFSDEINASLASNLNDSVDSPQFYRLTHTQLEGKDQGYYYSENGQLEAVLTNQGLFSVDSIAEPVDFSHLFAQSAQCKSIIQGPPGPPGTPGAPGIVALDYLTTFEDGISIAIALGSSTPLPFGLPGNVRSSGTTITQTAANTIVFSAPGAYLIEYVGPTVAAGLLGATMQFQLNGVGYQSSTPFIVTAGVPTILQTIVQVTTVPSMLQVVLTSPVGAAVLIGSVQTNVVKID